MNKQCEENVRESLFKLKNTLNPKKILDLALRKSIGAQESKNKWR